MQLAQQLGLDQALYSRNEPWVQDCLAMIVGRIVYAGSNHAVGRTPRADLLGTDVRPRPDTFYGRYRLVYGLAQT